MEKQANKLTQKAQNNFTKITLFLVFLCSYITHAQTNPDFEQGKKYFLKKVNVTGKVSYNEQTVVTFAGLEKGQEITIPGEEISNAIKKLGKLGLFSNIDFYVNTVEGDSISLDLDIFELPKLNEVKITGVRKGKVDELIKENALTKGKIVNENLITTTKNYLENKYKKDGYYNTKVNINTVKDTATINQVNMLVTIDKGDKVKIQKIDFVGNTKISGNALRKAMKETKQKKFTRILKASKFIKDNIQGGIRLRLLALSLSKKDENKKTQVE